MHRLDGLRIDRLTSFLHVIDHGGFSAAAQATGQPQPNLSRHVAELERALGVTLLTRGSQAVAPTEEGALVAEHVRRAVGQLEHAIHHLEESQDTVSGEVMVGMYPSAATVLYPRLLSSLGQAWPRIRLTLWEGAPHELSEALTADEIDVAVRPDLPPPRGADLHRARLWHEPLVLVVRDDDELADHPGTVPLTVIGTRPVVTIGNSASRAGVDAETMLAFATAGLEPDVAMRTDAPQLLAAMVAHGHGVGVTNALAMRTADTTGLAVLPVSAHEGGRVVSLWWHGPRPRLRRAVRVTAEQLEQVAFAAVG